MHPLRETQHKRNPCAAISSAKPQNSRLWKGRQSTALRAMTKTAQKEQTEKKEQNEKKEKKEKKAKKEKAEEKKEKTQNKKEKNEPAPTQTKKPAAAPAKPVEQTAWEADRRRRAYRTPPWQWRKGWCSTCGTTWRDCRSFHDREFWGLAEDDQWYDGWW